MLLASDRFATVRQSRPVTWTIVAPVIPYTAAEARQLGDYVREGGHLILIAGTPHRHALSRVLREFGIDLGPDPFGAAHNSRLVVQGWRRFVLGTDAPPKQSRVATGDPRRSYDAEISFVESYPVVAGRAESLVTCWGRPLAVRQRHGRGTVILIGDSRFVTQQNLGKERPNAVNLRFLLRCLE